MNVVFYMLQLETLECFNRISFYEVTCPLWVTLLLYRELTLSISFISPNPCVKAGQGCSLAQF